VCRSNNVWKLTDKNGKRLVVAGDLSNLIADQRSLLNHAQQVSEFNVSLNTSHGYICPYHTELALGTQYIPSNNNVFERASLA
jgi:hypothetical protein